MEGHAGQQIVMIVLAIGWHISGRTVVDCLRRLFFVLALISLPANVGAQAAREYEPRVGQAGKDVVWVPTPDELVERMLNLAKVTANDFLIDLGSGDGRTVIAAAKRGARAHGIEYNPEMVELSKRNAANERRRRAGDVRQRGFVSERFLQSDRDHDVSCCRKSI